MHEIIYASKPLYLEIDASGIDLGTCLLQMQEGKNCRCEEVPNNVALCLIAFTHKSFPAQSDNTATFYLFISKICIVP